jgi:hypothetical protein
MYYVSPEQIQAAKSVPLLDYLLSTEPDNIHKVGKEYRLRDHDSLTVSNSKFHWYSQNIGGSNAIDYLTKVRGLSFVEVVQRLTGKLSTHFPRFNRRTVNCVHLRFRSKVYITTA